MKKSTQISRRYHEKTCPRRAAWGQRGVLAESQAIFPKVAVARDFDAYQIKRGEVMKAES